MKIITDRINRHENHHCIIHVNQQDSGRLSILLLFPDPFEVAFVETSYTVLENVSTVEVCVNLTRPQIDILDEEVYVMVFNDPNSVYIPAGGVLASKSSYLIRETNQTVTYYSS